MDCTGYIIKNLSHTNEENSIVRSNLGKIFQKIISRDLRVCYGRNTSDPYKTERITCFNGEYSGRQCPLPPGGGDLGTFPIF